MIIKNSKHDWTFNTTEDVLDFCATVTDEKHSKMHEEQSESFNVYSWEETIDALTHGFSTKKMYYDKEQLTRLVKEELTKLGIKYDVTGDYLDVGAFMSGQPECFASFDYFPEDKPSLDIIVNIGKSWSIEPIYIENRGIAICSLIEILKNTYNIKCHIVEYSMYNRQPNFFRFNVNIEGYASFNQMMTYIGHTGFYRRVTLTMMERMFNKRNLSDDSYGQPTDIQDFDKTRTLYFEAMLGNKEREINDSYRNLETSKETILKIVNDLKTEKERMLFKHA
jgi:hypothetical protein